MVLIIQKSAHNEERQKEEEESTEKNKPKDHLNIHRNRVILHILHTHHGKAKEIVSEENKIK